MFARKFDPSLYPDALAAWDRWMAAKLISQGAAAGQPPIADNLIQKDPELIRGIPPATQYENDEPLLPEMEQGAGNGANGETLELSSDTASDSAAHIDPNSAPKLGRTGRASLSFSTLCLLVLGFGPMAWWCCGWCCRPKSRAVRSFGKQALASTKLV